MRTEFSPRFLALSLPPAAKGSGHRAATIVGCYVSCCLRLRFESVSLLPAASPSPSGSLPIPRLTWHHCLVKSPPSCRLPLCRAPPSLRLRGRLTARGRLGRRVGAAHHSFVLAQLSEHNLSFFQFSAHNLMSSLKKRKNERERSS
jgi:hypothetical protein